MLTMLLLQERSLTCMSGGMRFPLLVPAMVIMLMRRLVTKEEFLSEATAVFGDTSVQVTTEGRPYLGAPLGSLLAYVSQFVCEKVDQWSKELSLLSQIAPCCFCRLYPWHAKQVVLLI